MTAYRHYEASVHAASLRSRGMPIHRRPRIMLGAILLAGCALYLVQMNGLATKGYTIQDLERRSLELKRNNVELETTIAQLQSFREVAGRVQGLDMVRPPQVEYVQAPPSVALGR